MKSISSMEGYAEHYSYEVMNGGEPFRMEASKRRFYDAKNVWSIFQNQSSEEEVTFSKKRQRCDVFDSEESIMPEYDPTEFMSCFFTSLLDAVPLIDDSDTRDGFDL